MFNDRLSVKALLIAVLGYIATATIAFAVVVQFWIAANPIDPDKLARAAEADPTLIVWQNVIGTTLGICAGYIATYFSGSRGLKNALVTGAVLALYGVLGIYLHPSHPIVMQIGKLVTPIPLALLGGWIRLRTHR